MTFLVFLNGVVVRQFKKHKNISSFFPFFLPLENKECLAIIEEDEAKSLGFTLEVYATKNSSSKLSDYTNGSCKDQTIEFAYPIDDGMEEEAQKRRSPQVGMI